MEKELFERLFTELLSGRLTTHVLVLEAAVAIMAAKYGAIEVNTEQFKAIEADGLLITKTAQGWNISLCSNAEAAMIIAKEQFKGGLN